MALPTSAESAGRGIAPGMAAKISRRQALRGAAGLGIAAMGLLPASCTITKGTPPISTVGLDKKPAPGRKVNIEVYSVWGSTVGQGMVKLAEEFEKVQEDIGVRVVYAPIGIGGGSVQTKLFAALAGDNAPDVAQLVPSQAPQWSELGIMTDLTDRFKAAGLTQDDFFPPIWESMVYKDRVWQMQWDADPNFPFFWNKQLFEESGLDPERPPATIEEVDEYSAKILRKHGANVVKIGMIPWDAYGRSNSMFTWGWAFGGSFYDPEREEVTPDHELVVKALEWMVRYAKSVGGFERVTVVPPGLQLHFFGSGNVGMAPLVAPNFRDIKTNVKDMPIGATQLPYQPPGADRPGAGAWIGGWGMFVPSGARHKDEAFEFIRWVSATDEGTKAQWEHIGFPPAYRKAAVLEEIKNDPIMAPYYDVLVTATNIRPPIPVADYFTTQLEQNVDRAILGQVSPIEALRTVKRVTMEEWNRFRKAVQA
ncbi:MAG TPA: extracellular solute-binding protein [Actinopolymorphaceae bacterium]|jgi:multiple sugar transport system substrate-binding protein